MSLERSREAERVLMRVRTSADPAPEVERRVLERVEQRIAVDGGPTRAGADVGDGAAALLARAAPLRRAALSARAVRWRNVAPLAARLGRWGAFGLVAAAIGYHFGWLARERADAEASTPPSTTAMAPALSSAPSPPALREAIAAADPAAPLPRHEPPLPARAPSPAPLVTSSSPAPLVTSSSEPAPSGLAPDAASARKTSSRPAPRASHPPRASEGSPAPESGGPARPLTLAELLQRLLRAQASLRERDPHAALEQLDALDTLDGIDARHGVDSARSSALTDERLVLRALALCDLGRLGEARHVLAELDGRGADSIYRGRLEQACPAVFAR
jgi:hypothetical protein